MFRLILLCLDDLFAEVFLSICMSFVHRWSVGMHQIFSSKHRSSWLVYLQLSIRDHMPLILPFLLQYIFSVHGPLSDLFDFVTFYYIIIHYPKPYIYIQPSIHLHSVLFPFLFQLSHKKYPENCFQQKETEKKSKLKISIIIKESVPFVLSFDALMINFICKDLVQK